MQTNDFELIKLNLEKRISNCQKYLDTILSPEDLANITIKNFIELQSFCKQEQIDMTEILMVDLYHILGMGHLTLIQRNTFLSLINKYATYRSDMKCISNMKEITDLAKLPSISEYKLHKLGDIKLQSDPRGSGRTQEVLDETDCAVMDYSQAKKTDKALLTATNTFAFKTILVSGNDITMNVTNAKEFIKAMANDSSVDTLFDRCDKNQNYCDIKWSWADSEHTQLSGKILTEGCRISLLKKLKARKGIE